MARSKRTIILVGCAIITSFVIGTVFAPHLSRYSENKNTIIKNLETKAVIPTSQDSESVLNESVETSIKISRKNRKGVVSKNSQYPAVTDFPLGWFASLKASGTPNKVAREGMNILMPYVQEYNDETIMTFLDAAESAGVRVLLELRRSAVKAGDVDAVKDFVSKFKQHPAVFAWYLYDEPELAELPPKMLKQLYTAIKTEDSSKPITMSFALEGRLHNIREYRKAADILMFNVYPCRVGSSEFASFSGGRFYRYLNKRAARYSANREGFWPVLQGYGEKADGTPQFGRRLPTMAEERYMFYTSILAGSDGLFFWAHYRSQQPWIDSVLTPIVKEFSSYSPTILAGKIKETVKVDRSNIQAFLYQNPLNRGYLLVAINHEDKQINTTIKLDRETKADFARVREENRYVRLINNDRRTTFGDTFNPYEVHIYDIR